MGMGSTIRQWRENWAQAHELDALDRDQRDALAGDIGVSAEMLPAVAARPSSHLGFAAGTNG